MAHASAPGRRDEVLSLGLVAVPARESLGLRLNQSQNASAVAMATPDRKLAASLS